MEQPEVTYHGVRFTLAGDGHVRVTRGVDGRELASIPAPASCTHAQLDETACRWVADKLGAVPPPERHCDGCSAVLTPVFNSDTGTQFADVLAVKLSGGYGMFIDPISDMDIEALDVMLCASCAGELTATLPWADRALGQTGR